MACGAKPKDMKRPDGCSGLPKVVGIERHQVVACRIMAIAITLSRKQLVLTLEAIDTQIAAETARYLVEDSSQDAAADFGNDLHNLKLLRVELAAQFNADRNTANLYQCWFDPADSGLSLLRYQDVERNRLEGQLSDQAILQYEFIAHTGEEAASIRNLRQGWAPYVPMGEAAPCPTCSASYYPQGYGDCWRCGHIG
jgi:hypothetical protein